MPAFGSITHTPNTLPSQRAHTAFQYISEKLNANLIERQCFQGRNPDEMSPWGLYFAYHICRVHMPCRRYSVLSADIVKTIQDIFIKIDARWSVAGES